MGHKYYDLNLTRIIQLLIKSVYITAVLLIRLDRLEIRETIKYVLSGNGDPMQYVKYISVIAP